MEKKWFNIILIAIGLIILVLLTSYPTISDAHIFQHSPSTFPLFFLGSALLVFGALNFFKFNVWIKIAITLILLYPLAILWQFILSAIHGVALM